MYTGCCFTGLVEYCVGDKCAVLHTLFNTDHMRDKEATGDCRFNSGHIAGDFVLFGVISAGFSVVFS